MAGFEDRGAARRQPWAPLVVSSRELAAVPRQVERLTARPAARSAAAGRS